MSEVSQTPRTDAAELDVPGINEVSGTVPIAFARQLERELAEAKAHLAIQNALAKQLSEKLASEKHWLGDLERIQQLEQTNSEISTAWGKSMSELTSLREGVERLANEWEDAWDLRVVESEYSEGLKTATNECAEKLRSLLK